MVGQVYAALADVSLTATGGDILAADAGNRILAGVLSLANSYGAIGADPTANGSIPLNVGAIGTLSISNEGQGASQPGGGSINLVTLNDPALLSLELHTPSTGPYAGAHFSIAPQGAGLGLTDRPIPRALLWRPWDDRDQPRRGIGVIVADTPSITVSSGAGSQQGVGYNLSFGGSYSSGVANLSESAGAERHAQYE